MWLFLAREHANTRTRHDWARTAVDSLARAASITRVRFLLGGILLVAATLKAESLFSSSASLPWYLTTVFVFAELTLAGLLFSGAVPLHTWWAALLCFSCFAVVAVVKLWRGAADCGCFGAVATPPWVALAIDLSAVAALLFEYRERSTPRQATSSRSLTRWPMAVGFALIAVVGMKAVVSISALQPTLAAVDPARWVGQRLPLLDGIDVGAELSSGVWTVILHRHGCAKCADLLSDAKSIAEQPGARLALVELLPPNAKTASARSANGMLLGHLPDRGFNAFPVPLVLQINDGRVMFASDQFPPNGRELATVHSSHSVQYRTVAFVEKVK